MQIKVGGTYADHYGEIFTIMRRNFNNKFPYESDKDEHFKENGQWGWEPSMNDLIIEIKPNFQKEKEEIQKQFLLLKKDIKAEFIRRDEETAKLRKQVEIYRNILARNSDLFAAMTLNELAAIEPLKAIQRYRDRNPGISLTQAKDYVMSL